ncbi:MAG: GreA/GreB family elongation factor [Planctomycetota bacterium]|jgi:transcription elongation factor GreA
MHPDEVLKLAKKGKFQELEGAWMSISPQGPGELRVLLQVPEVLVERGHAELAESLLWYLTDSLAERGRTSEALGVARAGGRLLPASSVMRDLLAELYLEEQGDRSECEALLRLTVRNTDQPLDDAIASLEKALSLRPGTYVLDTQRGTAGRVDGLDPERGGLRVACEEGEKLYGPALLKRLERLEEDDFRALSVFEQDRLAALVAEDPEELVRIVLSSLDRRMSLRRLRLYLEPVVGAWSRWWSRARPTLRRSAIIGMTGGSSPSLFLRARPLSHGERLLRKFDSLDRPLAKLAMALDILREAREHDAVDSAALQHVADEVGRLGRLARGESDALALGAAAVAERMAAQDTDVQAPDLPAARLVSAVLADPPSLGLLTESEPVLLCALELVQRLAEDAWRDVFAAIAPICPRGVCEALAARLRAAGADEALAETRREVLAATEAHPGALAWLWRGLAGEADAAGASGVEPGAVALRLLSAMGNLVRSADLGPAVRKERIAELRAALFMRDGDPLRKALEGARPEQVAAVKVLGEHHPALTERMQADLMRVVRDLRPALFEESGPPWGEDVVYTTEAGMERRRAELEFIIHERLPEVMREIGQAAGFGDISDNAEYRSAVEERARLARRAARMQEELSKARLITPQVAAADHVTVGSRVRARNEMTGQVEVLSFLGPWDARPDDRVYAYNAPLGLAFMGKRVGQIAEFQVGAEQRRWEVLEIEPAV